MWNFIYEKLKQIVNWKIFAILIVLFVFCYFGFNWRQNKIENEMKKSKQLYSMVTGYLRLLNTWLVYPTRSL